MALGLVIGVGIATTGWSTTDTTPELTASSVAWPDQAAAAIALGDTVVSSENADESRPLGSITKLITVLVVLEEITVEPGHSGPTFRVLESDAARFSDPEVPEALQVHAGETVTLRELLEYTLVASSNAHATLLTNRIFGSEHAYLAAARQWLDDHGLDDVQVADSSGLSPQNRATPREVVELAQLATEHSIITELAAHSAMHTRDGYLIPATNTLLGIQGIDGLKTGFTTDADYTVVFTLSLDDDLEDGKALIGVVLGSPSDEQRRTDVLDLIESARHALQK